MKNILEFLEQNTSVRPKSTAFADENKRITYEELCAGAQKIGTYLTQFGLKNRPFAVLTHKSTETLTAMFGIVYSGNFYIVLDGDSPTERLNKILSTLDAAGILVDADRTDKAEELDFSGDIIPIDTALSCTIDSEKLNGIRAGMIDTDPLYALFTSGSTGVPKGAVINHRNVIAYTEWFVKEYDITPQTVFGNQTPFYFSMSVSDVFATLRAGAQLQIIPKQLFSFPIKLIEWLNERAVNTIYWVPSALAIVANWKVLDYGKIEKLDKILFAGEVMPVKQLNYWRSHYPNALFSNLFGPTETTDICTFYTVNRTFSDNETLPIGKPCDNCDVFVLNADGKPVTGDEAGELYVRGSFLSAGYFGNAEKTAAAFVQNPCNPHYPEPVYKTGDLVRYNQYGELEYISRIDFQIKHMGYRIELGEIENAAYSVEAVTSAAVIYDSAEDKIVLVYTGKIKETEMYTQMTGKVPSYMQPNVIIKIRNMPYNQNGKTDRVYLKEHYRELIKKI